MKTPPQRDALFVSLIVTITFALTLAAPFDMKSVPTWHLFYTQKLFAGGPLLFALAGYLWSNKAYRLTIKERAHILSDRFDLLIHPFILLSLVAYTLLYIFADQEGCPLQGLWSWLFMPRSYPDPLSLLSFLPALFVIFVVALLLPHPLSIKQNTLLYTGALLLHLSYTLLPIDPTKDPLAILLGLSNLHFFFLGSLLQKIYRKGIPSRITLSALLLFHVVLAIRILTPRDAPWAHLLSVLYFTFLLIIIYGAGSKVGYWIEKPPFYYWARHLFPFSVFALLGNLVIGRWIIPLLPMDYAVMPHLLLLSVFLLNLLLPLPFIHLYHKRKSRNDRQEDLNNHL